MNKKDKAFEESIIDRFNEELIKHPDAVRNVKDYKLHFGMDEYFYIRNHIEDFYEENTPEATTGTLYDFFRGFPIFVDKADSLVELRKK